MVKRLHIRHYRLHLPKGQYQDSLTRGSEEDSAWDAAMQLLGMRAGRAEPAHGQHSLEVEARVDRAPQLRRLRGGVIWASC